MLESVNFRAKVGKARPHILFFTRCVKDGGRRNPLGKPLLVMEKCGTRRSACTQHFDSSFCVITPGLLVYRNRFARCASLLGFQRRAIVRIWSAAVLKLRKRARFAPWLPGCGRHPRRLLPTTTR